MSIGLTPFVTSVASLLEVCRALRATCMATVILPDISVFEQCLTEAQYYPNEIIVSPKSGGHLKYVPLAFQNLRANTGRK